MSDSATLHFNRFNPYGNIDEEKLLNFIRSNGFEQVNIRQSKTTDDGRIIHANVQFESKEVADKALVALRYSSSDVSRELRVTRFGANIGTGAAFVAKLDPKVTSAKMHEALEEIVPELPVTFVHIPLRDKKNKEGDEEEVEGSEPLNKGFAIVLFSSDEVVKNFFELETTNPQAHKALVERVGEYQFSAYRSESEMQNYFTRVFVKNLPEDYDQEAALAFCKEHGLEINYFKGDKPSLSITTRRFNDGTGANWMVIGFADHDFAVKFIELMHDKVIGGRTITACRFASPRVLVRQRRMEYAAQKREFGQKYLDCNLVVHNLPVNVTNSQLIEVFGTFGEIARSGIPSSKAKEHEGRVCPQGFVQFKSVETARAAVEAINDKTVGEFEPFASIATEEEKSRKISVNVVKRAEERTTAVKQRGTWDNAPAATDDEFTVYENATEDERREILGNKLYPRIEEILTHEARFVELMGEQNLPVEEACSMITGMLIALDWTPEKLPMFEELLSNHTNLSAQIESGLKLIVEENNKAAN